MDRNETVTVPKGAVIPVIGRMGRALCLAAGLAAGLAGGVCPALADYMLGPGDKLEISIYGAPDLQRRATVNADGALSFPLVGAVPVKGLTIAQAREKLQQLLAEKKIMTTPDVSIEIFEHRPFFISGDVSRPGSYQWQPGMTVRHAVTLAGGYDMVRFRFGVNPFVQAADLRSEYEQYRADLFREETRLTRLKAEVASKTDIDFGDAPSMAVPPKLFLEVTDFERKLLRERLDTLNRERESLRKSVEFAREQAQTLDEQQKAENAAYNQQTEDFAKTKALADKGLVPTNRVLDEQRNIVLSRSRYLITAAQYSTAMRQLEESRRQLDRLDESRRADLLREMSEATMNIERINSRLEATAEKFAVVGAARSTIISGSEDAQVKIFRKVNGKTEAVVAADDVPVEPDDLLEITLKQAKILGAAVSTEGKQD